MTFCRKPSHQTKDAGAAVEKRWIAQHFILQLSFSSSVIYSLSSPVLCWLWKKRYLDLKFPISLTCILDLELMRWILRLFSPLILHPKASSCDSFWAKAIWSTVLLILREQNINSREISSGLQSVWVPRRKKMESDGSGRDHQNLCSNTHSLKKKQRLREVNRPQLYTLTLLLWVCFEHEWRTSSTESNTSQISILAVP